MVYVGSIRKLVKSKIFMRWKYCVVVNVLGLLIHFTISLANSIFIDLFEANTKTFLLAPGTISLLFLLLPMRKVRFRILAMCLSIAITFYVNQWHLAGGNKLLILGMHCVLLTLCLAWIFLSKGWAMASAVLLVLCISGVARQYWLEAQFNHANIYIVDDGMSCGSSGRCFKYYVEKGQDLVEERRLLFSSEEYVNVHFSTFRKIPMVSFDGMNNESYRYILCGGTLESLKGCENKALCY